MDVWEATRIMLRRWFVVLPILVLTGFLASSLGDRVQPEYSATSTIVMLPPFRTNGETGTAVSNPYLGFGTSLQTTASILQASVYRTEVRQLVAGEGLAPNYSVTPQPRSPLVVVTVTTDSGDKAVSTVNRVVSLLQEDLRARQKALRTPPEQTITTQVLAPAVGATVFNNGQKRVRYLVIGLGIFFSALAAFAVEGITRWSSRRKMRRATVSAAIPRSQPADRAPLPETSRVETSR